MCAAWTPPGLCMRAPTPTPTHVCGCTAPSVCTAAARTPHVQYAMGAHMRCARCMPFTRRTAHTPPTCTCCAARTACFPAPAPSFPAPAQPHHQACASVWGGGSRRTSSFPHLLEGWGGRACPESQAGCPVYQRRGLDSGSSCKPNSDLVIDPGVSTCILTRQPDKLPMTPAGWLLSPPPSLVPARGPRDQRGAAPGTHCGRRAVERSSVPPSLVLCEAGS